MAMASGSGGGSQTVDQVFKIVLMGDSGVGKSQLLGRFSGDEFRLDCKPTMCVDFQARTLVIQNKSIRAQILDTPGQERYGADTIYYLGAVGAILVYDITQHQTFDHIPRWLDEFRSHAAGKNRVIMLIGNKLDLENQRAVLTNRAKAFAEKNGLLFLETSALEATNVETAFTMVLTDILSSVTELEELFTEINNTVNRPEPEEVVQATNPAGPSPLSVHVPLRPHPFSFHSVPFRPQPFSFRPGPSRPQPFSFRPGPSRPQPFYFPRRPELFPFPPSPGEIYFPVIRAIGFHYEATKADIHAFFSHMAMLDMLIQKMLTRNRVSVYLVLPNRAAEAHALRNNGKFMELGGVARVIEVYPATKKKYCEAVLEDME